MNDSAVTVKRRVGKWLLLIHQIPPKPDYFRVKVGRRLQRMGAIPLKNSVYVLPSRDGTLEDFRWLSREIVADGGEATVCEAEMVEGITGAELVSLFNARRDAEYQAVVTAAEELIPGNETLPDTRTTELNAELTRLRTRVEDIGAIDFFNAPARRSVDRALAALEVRLRRPAERPGGGRTKDRGKTMQGLTWVTRRDVYIDRIACAWLVRRFIDPKARFKFTGAKTYKAKKGEVRFDMFEAEYTHEGDRCSFESLLFHTGIKDPALHAIGEIVHDIDCKDGKFGREETSGVAALVRGLVRANRDDSARLERGAAALDDLYASLR
jgi:hypothetical protein